MSESCYCNYDGDYPDVYSVAKHRARKTHKCYECGGSILPGEMYERAAGLYDGSWYVNRTCQRCLDVREYVTAHAPCFCWEHGSMLDDASATLEQYGHISAGFYIGGMKRVLRARNHSNRSMP